MATPGAQASPPSLLNTTFPVRAKSAVANRGPGNASPRALVTVTTAVAGAPAVPRRRRVPQPSCDGHSISLVERAYIGQGECEHAPARRSEQVDFERCGVLGDIVGDGAADLRLHPDAGRHRFERVWCGLVARRDDDLPRDRSGDVRLASECMLLVTVADDVMQAAAATARSQDENKHRTRGHARLRCTARTGPSGRIRSFTSAAVNSSSYSTV